MKIFTLCLLLSLPIHAQTGDKRLMTNAEYKTFLLQVETALPKWETALKNIDPEKNSEVPYSLGKLIVEQRDIGLVQVKNVRSYATQLRVKRTVSGELALRDFLESIFDAMNEIETLENVAGVAPYIFEKYAPELGSLQGRIGNDVLARVALLEKGTCPAE